MDNEASERGMVATKTTEQKTTEITEKRAVVE
jgi:hypothetical protein